MPASSSPSPSYSSRLGLPLQSVSVLFLPGRPRVKPEFKDDGDEHPDDGLRGHLGVPAPARPPALHHLLEVGHYAFTPTGGWVDRNFQMNALFREVVHSQKVTKLWTFSVPPVAHIYGHLGGCFYLY